MTRPYQGLSSLALGVKMRDPRNEVDFRVPIAFHDKAEPFLYLFVFTCSIFVLLLPLTNFLFTLTQIFEVGVFTLRHFFPILARAKTRHSQET